MSSSPFFKRIHFNKLQRHQFVLLVPFLVSCGTAFLGGLILFNSAISGNLLSTIISIGLDQLRSQLSAALLMIVGAALLGAMAGRSKLGAIVGAGIVFWWSYLLNFVSTELQPLHDPGGNLEPLNMGALIHAVSIITALALLCAFIGAAIGVALGEVLLDPIYALVQFIRQRLVSKKYVSTPSPETEKVIKKERSAPKSTARLLTMWLGTITMIILVLFASGSTDLFLFSPDTGIHESPILHSKNGLPVQGTIVQESVVSHVLKQRKPLLVYLPPSYYTPQGRAKHYPTLYVLHGSPGKDFDWFTGGKADQSANTLIDAGKIPELIIVSPEGGSEWGNSFDQRVQMENYVASELVPYIDQQYRTIPDAAHRAIGGNSMGAFGATNIAAHHPKLFGYVISLGGYYHAEGTVWGHNAAYMEENSPDDYIPNHDQDWKLHFYLGAATKDEPYYGYTKKFAHELTGLHISYQVDVQKGYHSWGIWQVQMYNALLWLKWGS